MAWKVDYRGYYINVDGDKEDRKCTVYVVESRNVGKGGVISGRTEVDDIKDCKVGDIWTKNDCSHTGIVREIRDGEVWVEHCSNENEVGKVEERIYSGKCWTESSESLTKMPPSTETQPEETPPKEPDKNAIQEVLETIGNIIDEIISWFG